MLRSPSELGMNLQRVPQARVCIRVEQVTAMRAADLLGNLPVAGCLADRFAIECSRRRTQAGSLHKKQLRFRRFEMPRLYGFGIALAAWVAAGTAAFAQDAAKYPEQMVRLIVPFSAGSMTDLLARTVAEKLSE